KLHQETKIMNKALEEILAAQKPDSAFEQRVLADFRSRIPQRSRFLTSIADLMRLRAIQISAVAALLLGLVQIGRMITGEGAVVPRSREYVGREEYVARPGRAPRALTDELSAARKSENDRDKETAAGKLKSGFGTITAAQPAATPATPQQAEVLSKSFVLSEKKPTETAQGSPTTAAAPNAAVTADRKLIRNANVQLEVVSFDDAVQKITAFANEERGYVATTSSEKQANGKLKGEIV